MMNRIQSEGSNWTCIAAYCLFVVGLRLPMVVSATTQAARLRGIDGVEVQTTEVDVMRTLLEIDPTERDRSRGLTAHFESGEQRSRRHKIETFNEIDIVSQRGQPGTSFRLAQKSGARNVSPLRARPSSVVSKNTSIAAGTSAGVPCSSCI